MAATRRVPLVLFLIADTGGGHRSAANAIRAAMDLIATEAFVGERPAALAPINVADLPFTPHTLVPPTWGGAARPWRAEIRDIFQECGEFPLRRTVNLYGPTVEKTPQVYSGFYHVTNTAPAYMALSVTIQRFLSHGLSDLLERLRPDVIVSVHPLLTHPALNLLRLMGVRVPFITVVTDLIRFHRAWAEPDVDVCSVPTAAARDLVIELGMAPAKVKLLGMPIHPKFCLPPVDRTAMLTELGLQPDRFTVLLVGGGDGVGGLGEATLALAAARLPIQLVVVTGRNRTLYHDLQTRLASGETPNKILGFVHNMPDLMRAADVIITKAGPGTIMEALSCGLPIILTGAIPGQEVGNIDYVEEHDVGELARTPEAVVEGVKKVMALSPEAFVALRERARRLGNPAASFDIAQLIFSHLPSSRSISVWNQMPRTPALYPRVRRPRRRRNRYGTRRVRRAPSRRATTTKFSLFPKRRPLKP